MIQLSRRIASIGFVIALLTAPCFSDDKKLSPIKVFVLAGDENVLEQGVVKGCTSGVHQDFFPNARPTKDEKKKHVNCAVYESAYSPETDYDKLKPKATGIVEIGDQRTRRISSKKRGREAVPYSPFPTIAMTPNHTTVLHGYISVMTPGNYELRPGKDDAAFNVTTLNGKEVYRRNVGQAEAVTTPIQLEPKKRYAFRTIFFKKPGHAFRVPLTDRPGTLETVVSENPKYASFKALDGSWKTRKDVFLYDAHPIHNNTKAPARPLRVGESGSSGPEAQVKVGVDLSLGHRLGDALDNPVLIVRHGTKHPIWFRYGSRNLGHDFRPPSSGGATDLNGSWDVIHFNHGVHDTAYRNPKDYKDKDETKYPICVPIDRYESNLRKIVTKLKKTGATLIWATTTPLHQDCKGWKKGDEVRYNEVAIKVMKENGVIINDLYAESIRQGAPTRPDVHSVGKLGPKVTQAILAAIAQRKTSTKPLPRVLMIGDSITGGYWEGVKKDLDGKAYVCKNPANAGNSDFGLASIDDWLDLKRYLLNGEEYLLLVSGVKEALNNLSRVYPGYQGQGAELAGLIWFQGSADGASPSMAESYEKSLANLIRDLRKDLNTPKLPVVVTALSSSKGKLTGNPKLVFDAQMAVGDGTKYPEFAGNVLSIDTRSACKPDSPGGRDPFAGNAESYLEIGDAMAEAILKLVKPTE